MAAANYRLCDGYFWPAEFVDHAPRYIRALRHLNRFLRMLPRDCGASVVQAGGHCGLWPLYLAGHFPAVYTFEPDARNFGALMRNVEGIEGIYPARGVLASQRGPCALTHNAENSGGHHIRLEPGRVPAYRIDDLALDDCGAIVLDVEGAEIEALAGAIYTVHEQRPWLLLEVRGHIEKKLGTGNDHELREMLRDLGYTYETLLHHDEVWRP